MDPHAFDRLARTFSQSASRRALGGLLGGALAAVAGTGEAKRRHHRRGKGNDAIKAGSSDCAHFCTTVFPPGPQRGQCISDAAHGHGLCVLCQADPANLCGATCCQAPDTCGGNPDNPGVCGHCTPHCPVDAACGADDGCGGKCQTGSCPDCRTCLKGTCVVGPANAPCSGGRVCTGTGVCVTSCSDPAGSCSCSGSTIPCTVNLSGGPEFACIRQPAPCADSCEACTLGGRQSVCIPGGDLCAIRCANPRC